MLYGQGLTNLIRSNPPGAGGATRRLRTVLSAVGRNPLVGYPLALVAVATAALLTLVLFDRLFSRNPFALYYAAVVLTAWVGGWGPGLVASAAAVTAINYLMMPSFGATLTDGAVQVGAFGFVALLVASLNARRRRAERELRQAKEAAESANAAKDQFLATLSHELRTPLTPVLTAAQVMASDAGLARETRESAEMIRRNVELEARLIDDLLDLTRISKGKVRLNVQPLDAHEAVRQVLEICRSDVSAKRIAVRLELGAAASYVEADAARLQQVLWNLLKNAVKFTPEGGTIWARTRNAGGTADGLTVLVVEVEDSGIGIEPEVLPKIFDAFEQGDGAITRQFGGLGLGLAITRALVGLHGGTVAARSGGRGKGATFVVELPTVPAPERGPEVHPAQPATCGGRSLRLLLVEDHVDTARIMSRLLRSWDYDVVTAGSVRDALATAATGRVDLVISDLGLPDGTGVDLMAELRRLYQLKGIALTGHGMEEDVRRCHEAGFLSHLTKPVNIDALRGVIQQALA